MDLFSLWSPNEGFIENNLTHFISSHCSDELSHHLFFNSIQWTLNPVAFSPPSFPYEWSSSGYSTMVQLYVHSGQLPTRALLASRRMSPCHCWFRCDTAETPIHLFSVCPVFNHLWVSTLDDIHQISSSVLEGVSNQLQSWVLNSIPSLFSPSSPFIWPHSSNAWFLGHVPFINHLVPLLSSHIMACLSQLWHTSFIHLAARIWGLIHHLSSAFPPSL